MKIEVGAFLILAVVVSLAGSVKVDWCTKQRYCPDGYRCCADEMHCCPIGYVCCYRFTKCCRSVLAPFASSSQAITYDKDMVQEEVGVREFSRLPVVSYPKALQRSLSTMSDDEKQEFMNRELSEDPVIIIYN